MPTYQQHRPVAFEPRYIRLGVGQPSGDPAKHRVFDVRATYDVDLGGWIGWVSEQNLNDQQGEWRRALAEPETSRSFSTAAACLGATVTSIVAAADAQAADAAPPTG